MKKLLLVLAVVLFANVARAENFGIYVGPKIGYQAAKLSTKKSDIKAGFADHFTAGIFGRVVVKNFVIQPELLWFRSGKVLNFNIDPDVSFEGSVDVDMNPSVTLTQQNLALPIFLGYQFDANLVKLRGNVGPVMYFLLSQKQEVDSDGNQESVDVNNLDTKGMTWGAAVNVGVDVWKLTLDISYSFGLSNYFGKDNVDWKLGDKSGSFKLDKTKQNIFTVTLGFKLFLL